MSTTEQKWTRERHEVVKVNAAAIGDRTALDMLAEIERGWAEIEAIRSAGGPEVAGLHSDAHGQNCLGCRIGSALAEYERTGSEMAAEIERLTRERDRAQTDVREFGASLRRIRRERDAAIDLLATVRAIIEAHFKDEHAEGHPGAEWVLEQAREACGDNGSPPAPEAERTQAERWAVTHFGDRDMWALLDERQRARMTTAMLPLVREARGERGSRPAPLTWDERAAVLRFLDREIARCAANPDPANAAIMAARASALRVAAGRIRAGDHAVGSEAPAPLTEAEARALATSCVLHQKRHLDIDRVAVALLSASRGDIPADVRPSELATNGTFANPAAPIDMRQRTAEVRATLAVTHPTASAEEVAHLDARPSEPTLTDDELDLVVAAIPLQTGLTRDGQRAIEAATRQAEQDKALREPPTASVEPGSGYADRRAAGEGGHGMAERWRPTVGARVVTANPLTSQIVGTWAIHRRPGVIGVARLPTFSAGRWLVRHNDGTDAPYDADELAPAPEVTK